MLKAESDKMLKITLSSFGAEMDKITEFIFEFYEKYTSGKEIDKAEFRNDIRTFIVALKDRIMKEEIAIYKSFEKLGLD